MQRIIFQTSRHRHEADGTKSTHAADLADRLILLVDDRLTRFEILTSLGSFPERQNPFSDDSGVMRASGQLLADVATLEIKHSP